MKGLKCLASLTNQFTVGVIYKVVETRLDGELNLIDTVTDNWGQRISVQDNTPFGAKFEPVELEGDLSMAVYPHSVNIDTEEAINHPNHYKVEGIGVIDFIESWKLDFNEGSIIKYVTRAKYDGHELKDLKKAKFCLDRLIALAEEKKENEPC